MRILILIACLLFAAASFAQTVSPVPHSPEIDDFTRGAGEPVPQSQLPRVNGFYSNAPAATDAALRARRAAAQSLKPDQLGVAPVDELQARCLVECKRLGEDVDVCKIGCRR